MTLQAAVFTNRVYQKLRGYGSLCIRAPLRCKSLYDHLSDEKALLKVLQEDRKWTEMFFQKMKADKLDVNPADAHDDKKLAAVVKSIVNRSLFYVWFATGNAPGGPKDRDLQWHDLATLYENVPARAAATLLGDPAKASQALTEYEGSGELARRQSEKSNEKESARVELRYPIASPELAPWYQDALNHASKWMDRTLAACLWRAPTTVDDGKALTVPTRVYLSFDRASGRTATHTYLGVWRELSRFIPNVEVDHEFYMNNAALRNVDLFSAFFTPSDTPKTWLNPQLAKEYWCAPAAYFDVKAKDFVLSDTDWVCAPLSMEDRIWTKHTIGARVLYITRPAKADKLTLHTSTTKKHTLYHLSTSPMTATPKNTLLWLAFPL